MSVSYKPLISYIERRGISVNTLFELGVITSGAATKLRNDKYVSLDVIDAICQHLDIPIEQVVRISKD